MLRDWLWKLGRELLTIHLHMCVVCGQRAVGFDPTLEVAEECNSSQTSFRHQL